MKKNIISAFYTLIGIGICVAGAYLVRHLQVPFLGNQLGSVAVACFVGPVWGGIVGLLSGLIIGYLGIGSYACIIPVMTGVLAIYLLKEFSQVYDRIVHTIEAICVVGLAEGVSLAIARSYLPAGTTILEFTDSLTDMLTVNQFPGPFIRLLSSICTVYVDVTISFLILFLFCRVRESCRKGNKPAEKAAAFFLVLCLGASLAAAPVSAAGAAASTAAPALMASAAPAASGVSAPPAPPKGAPMNGAPGGAAPGGLGNDEHNYVSRIYGTKDGLAGGASNAVVQTPDGTIWVGTYEGLYSFDGDQFNLQRDIPGARSVMCLCVGSDGSLWIGNNGTGLTVANHAGDFLYLDSYSGLPSDSIHDIQQLDESTYCVATTQGVALVGYDGTSLNVEQIFMASKYINRVAIGEKGTMAFYSNERTVYIARDGAVAQEIPVEDDDISCVAFDRKGRLYIGKTNSEIEVYTTVGEDYVMADTIDMEKVQAVNNLYFDGDVTYYAAKNGLGYIDSHDHPVAIYADDFTSSIDRILVDYQKNIWFTSSRNGLLCLEKSVFTDIFSRCNVSKNVTNSEMEWNGLLYVGTDKGLFAMNPGTGENVGNDITRMFGEDSRIRCVYVDSANSLWVSNTYGGTVEIEENGTVHHYDSDNGLNIGDKARFSTELSDGTMLISHNGGMALIRDHQVQKEYRCGYSMLSAYALSVAQMGPDVLLAGTDGEGILVYEKGELKCRVTRAEGLSSGIILRMVRDPFADGTFVLTGSGLCYLHSDYTAEEIIGFPYYNNLDFWITDDGTVFVLSSAGVFVIDYEDLMDGGECNTMLLDATSGLKSGLTSNGWNFLSDDGILYLAGNEGVYALDTKNYRVHAAAYKPAVDRIAFDDNDLSAFHGETIEIPAGVKKITLGLNIHNYTSSDPSVRYYLSGVDTAETVVRDSELSSVTYENLSHGSYDFHIEVMDDDGKRVVDQVVYHVTKAREAYEETGFIIWFSLILLWIMGSGAISVIDLAIRVSTERQRMAYEKNLTRLEREKAEALELALHQEEKANKSKSDFLASMSHEIRTPINAIIGMDTMILRETTQKSVKGYAVNVKAASETLLALINDILDFSKIESGKMELVPDEYDMVGLINDLINMIRPKAEAKDLAFNVSVSPDIPVRLYGDCVRIKQIILNILNNAVKYTEKGKIDMTIGCEKAEDGQIALSVAVADTGIGIKQEHLKKLFSPYERIEENRNKFIEGTGLGMSITKNLLEMMHSSLQVESVYGEGSTFSFTILQPVRSEEVIGNLEERLSDLADETETVELYHAPDAKLLVVDDVEMNLIVVTSLLKRIGIQVTCVGSGKEAIRLTKEQKYDLILMDSMMPQMSGEEALKIIKAECDLNKETPIIVLTANALKSAREEYLQAGFDDYLSKPIDGNHLEAVIRAYLPEDKIILDFEGEEGASETSGPEGAGEMADGSLPGEMAAGQLSEEDALIERIGRIDGIDTEGGIAAAGGAPIYLTVVRNFYDTASGRIEMIENLFRQLDIPNYTIQVHALKSSARLIGAASLSEEALAMEMAGREENREAIEAQTDHLLGEYKRIYFELDDIFGTAEEDDSREEITPKALKRSLRDLRELVDGYDFKTGAELMEELSSFKLPEDFRPYYRQLRVKFAEVDHDGIIELLDQFFNQG